MIITVTFNPAIDKTAEVDDFYQGGLNRLKNVTSDAGGKGVNVSKTIQAFGGTSICTGFLAGSTGDMIEQTLDSLQISHDFVRVAGNTRTNLKILDKYMELTELNEAGPFVSTTDIALLKQCILKHCDQDSIVVLSGNVSPGVSNTIYEELITDILAKGAHVVFDADGELFANGIKAHPTCIKPNKHELAMYFGMQEDASLSDVIKAAKKLLDKHTQLVVVSMGREGSIFISEEAIYQVDALSIQAHSSVGAGDAMVAGIAYAMANHMNLQDTIRLAVAASAGAVLTKGTKPASIEIVNTLKQNVVMKTWEEK